MRLLAFSWRQRENLIFMTFADLLFVLLFGVLLMTNTFAQTQKKAFTDKEKNVLKATKIIKLEIKASTWREGKKPYAIDVPIKEKLLHAGFEVVDDDNKEYDGVLYVNWEETKGMPFKSPKAEGFCTNVVLRIRLIHEKVGEIFSEATAGISEFCGPFVSKLGFCPPLCTEEDLHRDAINNLTDRSILFKYLSDLISASLGILGKDKIDILILALNDEALRYRASKDLMEITGQDLGMEPKKWQEWRDKKKPK